MISAKDLIKVNTHSWEIFEPDNEQMFCNICGAWIHSPKYGKYPYRDKTLFSPE